MTAGKLIERMMFRGWANADIGAIWVTVEDTGIGFVSDTLPLVFESFQQADSGTTRRYGGRGLGLASAKRLAKLQGGRIDIESTLNEGSTFTLVLPINPGVGGAVEDDNRVSS